MMKIILTISVLFCSPYWVESLDIPIITNIQDIIGLAHDVGDILAGNIPFKNLFTTTESPLTPVLNKIDGVAEQIENLDTKLDDLLASIISRIPLEDNINADIRDLQQIISKIDETYNEFIEYSENITIYDDDTLLDYVTTVTSTRPGNVPDLLKSIFNIIVPKDSALVRVGFLENMQQKRKLMAPLELCGSLISSQNRLLQIYNLISITEMRAFVMTMFGFRLKMELKQTKSIGEIARARSGFVMRLEEYLIQFKKIMRKASREIFICDPESLTDPSSYIELEGLFAAIVINEYQVNTVCDDKCYQLSTSSVSDCYTYGFAYCMQHPCQGKVNNCGWIGGNVDFCEYPRSSLKRYDYVNSHYNGMYGKRSDCSSGSREAVSGRHNDLNRCDMCICRCEEFYASSRAIRTFSLRPQVSNIDENKVVSDVKFVLKDKMIHIQIEEAPLLPIGQVDRNQSSWVPLEDFIYLSNVTDGGWVQVKDGQYVPMTRDTDFAFIRSDQRVLNLDEISAGPDYVLTGARLNHESEKYSDDKSAGNISPLQLEIHVTPFDYVNGKLIPTEEKPSMWLTPLTQPQLPQLYAKKREEVGKDGEKVYRYESVPNPPHLKPNMFINFKQSTIHSDAGQSTVPFLEARSTAPFSPVAFDGLGLAWRGNENYGGFIILKAMTIDLSTYIESSMTPEQQKFYLQNFRQSVPQKPIKTRGKGRKRFHYNGIDDYDQVSLNVLNPRRTPGFFS